MHDEGERTQLPELRWEQYSVPWTIQELTVVWAAAPKDLQRYNQAKPVVREVADLIGRSPSAVDRKMANLWSVWRPGHGLPHAGHLDGVVVERYRHDLGRLARDASEIRGEVAGTRPTVRAETEGPDDSDARTDLLHELRARAREPNGEEFGIHVYERAGSWYIGFFAEAYQVLTNPDKVTAYAVIASGVYTRLRPSIDRMIERIRDRGRFAREVVKRVLPDLEQMHFSVATLEQIARQLARYEVDPFHFNQRLSRAFRRLSESAIAVEVERFFHIVPPADCQKCTIILAAAARRAMGNPPP